MMEIKPLDLPWRWLCQSQSRPGMVHLVDLMEGEGGACSCENYEFRQVTCSHITAVREFFMDLLIQSEKRKHEKASEHGHSLRKINLPDV